MLPSMRQRLVIGGAVVVGALGWLATLGSLRAADGSTGLSLASSPMGFARSTLLVLAAGLPAVALGLVSAATGHPLAGVFAVAISLVALAAAGGPIDGWIYRSSVPADYKLLLLETFVWQLGVCVLLMVIQRLRSPLRSRLPVLATHDHLGVDMSLRFPQAQAIASGLVSALVAALVGNFLLRSTSNGQVIGALLVAFTAGGVAGQLTFYHSNPVGILMSPALVAAAGYGYVIFSFNSEQAFLRAWYEQRVLGIALVLPIFYASAALAGSCMGVGIAQSLVSHDKSGKSSAAPGSTPPTVPPASPADNASASPPGTSTEIKP